MVFVLVLYLVPTGVHAFSNGQLSSVVLGQADFTSNAAARTSTGMNGSIGLAFDPSGNLWVADVSNNRVLEFIHPFSNGEAASVVLGQTDFTSAAASTTSTGMNAPVGVASDSSGNIWVADSSNNRVLEFTGPFFNGQAASLVVGQVDFTHKAFATTSTGLGHPAGVAFDSSGNLWVADTNNIRVLEFTKGTGFTNGQVASVVLGQPDFTHSTTALSSTGMHLPTSVASDSSGNVWVADSYNNRVLEFTSPFSNGQSASVVLGQPSFTSAAGTTTDTGMYFPFGVGVDSSNNVWVAERGNSRVLMFLIGGGFTNGEAASVVLGQPDFTSSNHGTTSSTMSAPSGVSFDSSGRVFVADLANNRVIGFKTTTITSLSCSPFPVTTGSPTLCTATVMDTEGAVSTPTGKVKFTSSVAGTFSEMKCKLSGGGSSASCAVTFTASVAGSYTITAKYAGDAAHLLSKGKLKLKVT